MTVLDEPKSVFTCPNCKRVWRLRPHVFPFTCVCGTRANFDGSLPTIPQPVKTAPIPRDGPGTEFKALVEIPACGACEALCQAMNQLGVKGCRERFDEILLELERNSQQLGWTQKAKVGASLLRKGIILKVNLFDPLPGILREAIKRAAKKERAKK